MKNYLEYKGYKGSIEFSPEDNLLCGEVLGVPHTLMMYDGQTLQELQKSFEEAIEFHLSCIEDESSEEVFSTEASELTA